MPGFPPLDDVYYNNPSVRVGGWIGFWLSEFKSNRFNLIPGKSRLGSGSVQHFGSLQELSSVLSHQHHDSHYYRGQTGRYETFYRGRIPNLAQVIPWAQEIEIAFESMIPSLFRPLFNANSNSPPDWQSYRYPSLLDQIAPAIRAIIKSRHEAIRNLLAEFIREELRLLALRDLASLRGWNLKLPPEVYASMTNVPKRLLKIISLSQHYEYQSVMVDLTSSVDVAVWFSSHNWSGQLMNSSDKLGVIYRFDQSIVNAMLEKELQEQGTAAHLVRKAGLFGLIDISAMETDFGLRPQRQAGASLLGLENSITFMLLDAYKAAGAIDVFTFPLRSADGKETKLSKERLCPADDPVLAVFDESGRDLNQPILDEELSGFLEDEAFPRADIDMIRRARKAALI